MSRRNISSGSTLERDFAYSRAVVAGPWVFVSGCTGYDYATMRLATGAAAQAEQCMANVEAALRQAGACVGDVVRVRYIVADRADVPLCAPVWRRWLQDVRPAATLLVAGLVEEEIRVEVEVTAYVLRGEEGEGTVRDEPAVVESLI